MTSPFAQLHNPKRARTSRRTGAGLWIGWILLALLATAPATTWAAPPLSIDLRWEAPAGCPQESDVRDRIQSLLGPGRHDSKLRAEGTIARLDKRFRLDLVVRVRELAGTRTIESGSCEDLAGAAAVEIALLVHSAEAAPETSRLGTQPQSSPTVRGTEPSGSRSSAADSRASQETSEAGTSAREPSSSKPESKTEITSEDTSEEQLSPVASTRTWHALVQVPVLELDVGLLPQVSRGIGLALGLEFARWQLQVKGISWQRQNVSAPGLPGYGADVDRMGAAFWGCREYRASWFGFSPCITVGLERVSVTGTGRNIVQSTQHAFGMTAGAGAQGRIYLASWIRLLMAVGGKIVLSRPQISVAGGRPAANLEAYRFDVYEFAPAALTVAVGLEWIL